MAKKSIYDVIDGQTVIFTDKVRKIIVTQDVGRPNFPIKIHKECLKNQNHYDYIGLKFVPNEISTNDNTGNKLLSFVKDFLDGKN